MNPQPGGQPGHAAGPRARKPSNSRRKPSETVCRHYHGAVELIGRRWSGAILYSLTAGPRRFAELKGSVPGMSDRLLSARLKELEEAGLIERSVQEGTPVRVTYALTAKGESLGPVIDGLRDWARRWHRS